MRFWRLSVAGLIIALAGSAMAFALPTDSSALIPASYGASGGKLVTAPFMLDSGVIRANESTGWSPNAVTISGSLGLGTFYTKNSLDFYDASCISPTTAGTYFNKCAGFARTNSGKVCPQGFIPYISTTPLYSESSSGGASSFACAGVGPRANTVGNTLGVYGSGSGSHYVFQATISATSAVSGQFQYPSTAFRWEVSCYPVTGTGVQTPPINTGACSRPTSMDLPVVLWDFGRISWATGKTAATFDTHRRCPVGYTARVWIAPPSIVNFSGYTNSAYMISGYGVCVSAINNLASPYAYRVTYMANINYAGLDIGDTSIDTFSFRTDFETQSALRDIHWFLYCTPPGFALSSTDQAISSSNCNTSTSFMQ